VKKADLHVPVLIVGGGGAELVGIERDTGGVTASVLNRDTGDVYVVRSAYLLGADGGRTVGEIAGIGMNGMTNLRHVVNVHLSADLSAYFDDPEVFIRWQQRTRKPLLPTHSTRS
jgi:2,4-dichlorophenol 6-monooxygenase